jgi:hypothetical protein
MNVVQNAVTSKHSKRTGTSTGTKSEATILRPEFVEFTKQLRVMREYFSGYDAEYDDETVKQYLGDIDRHLSDLVSEIAELVAVEFKENVYYGD